MTKAEAVAHFKKYTLPLVIQSENSRKFGPDYPMRREAWNVLMDGYLKGGEITKHQYNTWVYPHKECGD